MNKIIFIIVLTFFGISSISFSQKDEYGIGNKILVRFKQDIRNEPSELDYLQEQIHGKINPILLSEYSLKYNPKNYFLLQGKNLDISKIQETEVPILKTYIIELPRAVNLKHYCNYLQSIFPEIDKAEPYYPYQIQSFVPNDTYYSMQTSLSNIKAEEAWGVWKGDSSVVIAISDNGVYQSHEDIKNSLYTNWGEIPNNGIDDDGNGYIDDYRGYNFLGDQESQGWGNTTNNSVEHGTMVAGIAGATFNNNLGIAGIGGYCRLFPIKAAGSGSSIIFGNESIVFAAVHHFSVLNLSWGGPREFSELEQSIIDYAVANGVAIVAAGGNIGTNGGTRYDTYYPAGYYVVLGVGEVDQYDAVTTETSCMGVQVNILAPGMGDYCTTNNGGYSYAEGGTSFSSPVVAGAVALARSKYPNLTPLQSLEFVRQCTDDVTNDNISYADIKLVPGRLDLYKVVTVDPFSIPALKPSDYLWQNSSGIKVNRFATKDTAYLMIKIKNILGKTSNVKFALSDAYDPANSIQVIQPNASINYINTNDEIEIGPFEILILKNNPNRVILRMDISADNNYSDMFKLDFIPTANFATFESDSIIFSMSDKGDFGFVSNGNSQEGKGFTLKGIGNQLYGNSGLIIEEDAQKVVSIFDQPFQTEKQFALPDYYTNIINDNYSDPQDKIGLQITQKVSFPNPNVAQIDITTKNNTQTTLKNLALGYYYDWDINEDADNNIAQLFDEINSSSIKSKFSSLGAEIIYKPNVNIFVGCVALSKEDNTTAEIAGLDYDFTSNFTRDKQIQMLTSGTSLQSDVLSDRSLFTGIMFNGDFAPMTTKTITLLVGAQTNRQDLASSLISAITTNDVKLPNIADDEYVVQSFPDQNIIKIFAKKDLDLISEIKLYDFFGNEIRTSYDAKFFNQTNEIILNLPEILSQVIFVRIKSSLHNLSYKILWVKNN
jgi:hypothetical protein